MPADHGVGPAEQWVVTGGEGRIVWIMDGSGALVRTIRLDTWINDLAAAGPGVIVVAGNKGLLAVQLEPAHPAQ